MIVHWDRSKCISIDSDFYDVYLVNETFELQQAADIKH